MKRRTFLKSTLLAALPAMGSPPDARFRFTLLQHGEHWSDRERALRQLAFEIQNRCNIPIDPDFDSVPIESALEAGSPFFVLTGKGPLPELSTAQADSLRIALNSGGFLLIDDQSASGDNQFITSAVAAMHRAFPEVEPAVLPSDHSIYQSYYLLKEARGRTNKANYLTGWNYGIRTIAAFSHNDLLGAMEADRMGSWTHNMEIGGGFRRELCFRLGINITYYVLTVNYKKDRAFPPVIERRRRL